MNAGLAGDCVVFSVPTGSTYANSVGIAFGDSTHTPSDAKLSAFVFNCQKGLLDTTYASGGAGNEVNVTGFNTSATPLVFANGTSTGAFATALAQLVGYDFDININGTPGTLGYLNMENRSGVRQTSHTVQGADSGIELGYHIQGTSALSAANPRVGIIRNGTTPTVAQIYLYDGTTFVNFLGADLANLQALSYQDLLLKNPHVVNFESTGAIIIATSGSPNGVVTAKPGSVLLGSDGTLWLKATGSGNTGWVQISSLAIPVTVPNGGTGDTTLTVHGVLVGEGTAAVSAIAGVDGQTLIARTGADPLWQNGLGTIASPVTITTAKLTPGGSNGVMEFVSGLLVFQTQAT